MVFQGDWRSGRLRLLAAACVWAVAVSAAAAPPSGFRVLAPGVLTVIPPDRSVDDPLQRTDLLEITQGRADRVWTPKRASANTTLVERAKEREQLDDVWCLEFAFKAPRILDIDVPVADSQMRRKRIWYLLYRVRNLGGRRMVVDPTDPGTRNPEAFEQPIRFLPHFVLESFEHLSNAEDMVGYRAYLDRVLPTALEPIQAREQTPGRLYDSGSMTETAIRPGETRWGVAVWEDIDPRIDYFSIYIRGLTNAIRWRQYPGSTIGRDDVPGEHMEQCLETLRLDFWRPGDDRDEIEEEMCVGYAGMFERMTLGSRLLEAASRPRQIHSRPGPGLDALGLKWTDLLEPNAGVGMPSLLPLEKVLRSLAALPDAAARDAVVQDVFGDLGTMTLETLTQALSGPVEDDRDAARRAALQKVGLTPEQVAAKPLESLATVVRALEAAATHEDRLRAAGAFCGPDGRRVELLATIIACDRTLVALEELGGDRAVVQGDSLAAYELVQRLLDSYPQPGRRQDLLQGLFGPRGPELYSAAAAVHEGIDHAWVFRYERDAVGP